MKLISEKHPVAACFLLVLIAYFPVVCFQFAIKNDFFSAYFPLKYFLSESINAGSFPLWNPFLNYGFPVYGDMSEAYWNPLTWLIAATVGYNPWTFTIEIIFYIFIACRSMYALSAMWIRTNWIKQLVAVAFACSGFFVGHLQHFNWISGAALLPLCMLMILHFVKDGKLSFFLGALISTTWFLTSAHPGIIIGMLLFMIPLLVHARLLYRKALLRISVLLLAILTLGSGMLYAYLEVLPFTNRSAPVGSLATTLLSTSIRSWVSVFMSLPITKADAFFGNDIAMRNSFFGVLLLASLAPIFAGKVKGSALYFACCGLAFLLLSSEIILSVYPHLPLVNYVRLNSEFRIFAILSFIIAGGISLEYSVKWKDFTLLRSLQVFRYLYIAAVLSALVFIIVKGDSITSFLTNANPGRPGIKTIIHSLSFADAVLIHGLIQLLICSMLIRGLKTFDHMKLLAAGFAEIAFATLLNLPFTGVGQRSVQDIDRLLSKAPRGIVAPIIMPEDEVARNYPMTDLVLGNWSLYSKQIAMDSLFPYPQMLRTTLAYAQSEERKSLMIQSPFFLKSQAGIMKEGIQYSFQQIIIAMDLPRQDTLVIKQNNYPGWSANIDGEKAPLVTEAGTFIGVPLSPGKHEITVAFRNEKIKILVFTEFFLLLIAATALLMTNMDQRIRYIFP